MIQKERIKITGMSCSACANRIEKGLNGVDGVKKANVNFAVENATVEYDDSKVSKDKLIETVKNLGYGVIKEEKVKNDKVSLLISGMGCAACSARIEKKLNATKGIKTAAVNLATNKAAVTYDASQIKLSEIIKTIEGIGYGAQKAEEESRD
ncbi:MAG: copper ion binding protein, partial [Bacillota bacterium]|nr:copper ion binding protein [Bacillota bacterium]